MKEVSTRAQIITRRTYCRPLNEEGTQFETWEMVIDRVIKHQKWLWERALTHKEMPEIPLHDISEDLLEWVSLEQWQLDELEELRRLLLDRKVAVSGRTLWLGGTEIGKKVEASQFNCSALNIETVYDVVDAFWLLLNGSGVGFRPVPGNLTGFPYPIKELELIRSRGLTTKGIETNEEHWDLETRTWTIRVGDSALAWAKFIGKLLAGKYRANKLVVDFSEIRAAGIRLRQYGWISQGDRGLASAVEKIFAIMNRRADSLLTAMDILDVVNLLGTILSTRRSAQIAVYDHADAEWEEFSVAKNGMFENGKSHRTQSNNSLFFSSRPKKKELRKLFEQVMMGGGEPGIINGETMQRRSPWASLTNPCVTGDTLIETDQGYRTVADLVDVAFNAKINGQVYKATGFWSTGIKDVYEVKTQSGYSLKATSNHKILTDSGWKELSDISIGDSIIINNNTNQKVLKNAEFDIGWLLGEIIGDGGYNPDKYSAYVRFWNDSGKSMFEKAFHIAETLDVGYHQPVSNILERKPGIESGAYTYSSKRLDYLCEKYIEKGTKDFKDSIFHASDSFIAGMLSGLFDADGSVQGNLIKGVSIRLSNINLRRLEIVQLLLLRFGIKSTLYKNRKPAGFRELPDGNGNSKEYFCQDVHELVISNYSYTLFGKLIGFSEPAKQQRFDLVESSRKRKANKDKFSTIVTSIEYTGREEVFDCTVADVHRFSANGIIAHNCGEILLSGSGGFCNLVTINLMAFDGNIMELLRAAKIITRANYRQTVVDFRDGILQEKWHLNNAHLHLCGVSLMGVVGANLSPYEYTRLERTITTAGYGMAKELSSGYPKQLTTMKPEGTISKCYDSTEGMHKPLGRYILNNVAFSVHDPLVTLLKDANYRVFTHPYDPTAMLVTLPVEYKTVKFDTVNGKEVNAESAISQLERYKMLMQYYCHQNVSCTISYDPSEADDIVKWLHSNWDNYVAVSFLLRNDASKTAADLGYPYLPQEVTTKEIFTEYVSKLLPVNFDNANSFEELTDNDCSTGACPIR